MTSFRYIFAILLTCMTGLQAGLPQYICTAVNARYYHPYLLNLIGSIHKTNYDDLAEIAVFDLGLLPEQRAALLTIDKVAVYDIDKVHPDILKPFITDRVGNWVPGWYAWKYVAIKQALDKFPYVLWLDAGSTILRPLDDLFAYIKEHGYFLGTIGDGPVNGKCHHNVGWGATQYVIRKFHIDTPELSWILEKESVMGCVQGVSRAGAHYYLNDMYEMAKDLRNWDDDGTTPNGFGTARHDQTLLSILAYGRGLKVFEQDYQQKEPMLLSIGDRTVPFYITWSEDHYSPEKTTIYNSRGDLKNLQYYISCIRLKK